MVEFQFSALRDDLASACQKMPEVPALLHSDLFRIGLTAKPTQRQKIFSDYEEALKFALGERALLVPTFNYDFCKDGLYDRSQSKSQVGALSDFYRQKYPQERTLTPIFNFVIKQKSALFSFEPTTDVLGAGSIFETLYQQNGLVLFLGADFSTNTFLHYIEECNQIGYRYLKLFSGQVLDEQKSFPMTVHYRVRPLIAGCVVYDWGRLIPDARQILHRSIVGRGELLWYRSQELFDFWSSKIQADEFYLLTPDSRKSVLEQARLHGYPFSYSRFETVS